jgi:hypothetical protein
MATSGTTTFTLDLSELVEEAFELVGGELRSGYDLRTARRSLNILLAEWANQGINLWTIAQGEITLVPGTATYALPADTVDLIEHTLRTGAGVASTQSDITLSRISVSTYAAIPNKLTQARPLQLLVERLSAPQVTLWPVPDASQAYTLVYWRLRRLHDAGNGQNTMDVPFRFIPPLVAGLAHKLAMKVPGALERVPLLKEQYDRAWDIAAGEDREKASVHFVPQINGV